MESECPWHRFYEVTGVSLNFASLREIIAGSHRNTGESLPEGLRGFEPLRLFQASGSAGGLEFGPD
jgi:hypothetical protein